MEHNFTGQASKLADARPTSMIEALSMHADSLVKVAHRLENMTDRVFGAQPDDCAKTCGIEENGTLANQIGKIEIQISRINCLLERLEQSL